MQAAIHGTLTQCFTQRHLSHFDRYSHLLLPGYHGGSSRVMSAMLAAAAQQCHCRISQWAPGCPRDVT